MKKAYQVNVDYPEGFLLKIEESRKKVNIGAIVGPVVGLSVAIALVVGVIYYIVSRNNKKEGEKKKEQTDRYVGETKANYDMHFDEEDESQETSQNNVERIEGGY